MNLFIMSYDCLSFPGICNIAAHSVSCYYLTIIKLTLCLYLSVNRIPCLWLSTILYVYICQPTAYLAYGCLLYYMSTFVSQPHTNAYYVSICASQPHALTMVVKQPITILYVYICQSTIYLHLGVLMEQQFFLVAIID